MNLSKGRDCGREVSPRAKRCPACGCPVPTTPLDGCVGLIGGLMGFGVVVVLFWFLLCLL